MTTRPLEVAALLLVLCGCSFRPGDSGDAGLVGPPGPQGALGLSGATGPQGPPPDHQLVFRDAAGTFVSRTAPFPSAFHELGAASFMDERGFLWRVHPESGQIISVAVIRLDYVTTDCTGDEYVPLPYDPGTGGSEPPQSLLPRMPFQLAGESQLRIRPDHSTGAVINVGATRAGRGAACTPTPSFTQSFDFVLTSDSLPQPPIDTPTASFVPPLHWVQE